MSKIIIIGPAYPLRGGLATFNERMARQFIANGHDVKIYTFSLQYPNFLFPGKTQYSQSPPPADLNIEVCINSINPFNWWQVGSKLKAENADLIIVRYWLPFMGPSLGTILQFAKRNNKTKIIGLIDNALPHEKRLGDRMFTSYFTDVCDGFVTMSEYVKLDLQQFTNLPVQLIQHPLYDNFGIKHEKKLARQKLGLAEDKYIYLFFGFIRKYKGLKILLEAFEKLKDQDALLLIAGEYYAGEDEIKEIIASSTARADIAEHTHFINDEEVSYYFSAADCVVQPYINATQSGVTPLAYHFEVPMIVTNVGALPDLVPPSLGIVCEPNADSVHQALKDVRHLDLVNFNIKIKEEKLKLSWEKLAEVFIQFINKNQENAKNIQK